MKGRFITLEGPEGSGKSTQGRLLARYLKSRGYKALSEKIRRVLLDKSSPKICPMSEMLLYMAARAQLMQEVIRPALRKGYFVVCDRFLDSTIAYQGYGLGVDLSLIEYLGNFLTSDVKPDLTIFLDVAVKKGLSVCGKKLDRIEQRPLTYHRRVRRGYLELAAKHPERFVIIKPDKDKRITQTKIRKVICDYGF
jgi:dTMP kinase